MAAPPPVHVTYLALGGGGDGGAVFEAARSAFSLCRLSPKASVLLVTNTEALANAAAAKLRAVCPEQRVSVITLNDEQVLATLRAANFTHLYGHQSGPGGYAKLVPTDWLPASVERTLLIDTDTLFARDPSAMWNRTFTRFGSGQLLAMTPFVKQGFGCVRTQRPTARAQFNQRFNSGVQLLDVAAMRRLDWAANVARTLSAVRQMPVEHGCSWFVQDASLCVGDQELLSLVCASTEGACGNLPPNAHCDRCGNTDRGKTARGKVIYHSNCAPKANEKAVFCEDPGCRDALAEFRPLARRHGWAPRKFSRAGVSAWSAKGSGRSCNGALANWTAFRKTERARLQFNGGSWVRREAAGGWAWDFVKRSDDAKSKGTSQGTRWVRRRRQVG